MINISERIKTIRRHNGFSQRQLAAKIGTSQKVVSRWETGGVKPRVASLQKIADVGGVTFEWLNGIVVLPDDKLDRLNERLIDRLLLILDEKDRLIIELRATLNGSQ